MQVSDIFLNSEGRLRSGWRATVFGLVFFFATSLLSVVLVFILSLGLGTEGATAFLTGNWGFVVQGLILFLCATLIGFACLKLFEDLPLKALGWTFHRHWLRDWFVGSILGAVTILFATLVAVLFGGFKFAFSGTTTLPAVGKTLGVSCLIFIFAAAAEEVLFRGYPLQTFTRANFIWVGIVITSIFFAMAHLGNPNQTTTRTVNILAVVNTALAGVWLAVIYLKTRSLWLPLGVHWAWNWMMAAVLGLPVSGITTLTPNPLFRATDLGPAWLTGGPYGIEGGAACTFAIVLSSVLVWRSRLFSATDEMLALTTGERPGKTAVRAEMNPTLPAV
jgi:uncharacterized protein